MKPSICTFVMGCTALWHYEASKAVHAQGIYVSRDANSSSIIVTDNNNNGNPPVPSTTAPAIVVGPGATTDDTPPIVAVSNDTIIAIAGGGSSTAASGKAGPPPASLIPPTDAMKTFAPPKYLDASTIRDRAIPTNNWWGNIIAHDTNAAIQPVWANPFALQVAADTAPFGLSVSYPFRSRVTGGSTGNGNANRYYAHGILREFMFSAAEFSARPTIQVTDWADIGVTLRLQSASNAKAQMETTLVSGMAYVSATYSGGISPKLVSTASIASVNGRSASGVGEVTASKFEIVYNSGQKWILYALSRDAQKEQPITLKIEAGSTLVSSGTFDGMLRATLALQDTLVTTLDQCKSCVVQGASVVLESDTAYAFNWKTMGNCASGMLHYAMQHQLQTLDSSSGRVVDGMLAYSTTRGALQGVISTGTSWKFKETQPIAEDFYPSRKIAPQVVKEQRLLEQLTKDIQAADWSIPLGGSYYFNGKAAQKYASLCLMANDPALVGQDKTLLTTCLGKLRKLMAPFLDNSWTHKLQYDRVYGGIVSSEGFVKNDLGADFGNTMYNDHHFHYGYWIYTSAVINLLDPTWSELSRLNTMATLLARDVANYETDEQFFPRFRAFDWFRGHSYSHGVTPFADGKDQESTSEDMNFSYGFYLFGKITKNARMEAVGKLMARLNAHAVRTYFLIDNSSAVHPSSFKPNKVTGIFFDNKVDYATWFSAEKHCIHGIQMIPISPMTEFVRSKQFVKQEWTEVLASTAIVTKEDTANGWLSLLYANYATVDKTKAMDVLQKAKMDDGLTRAWALYMAASQA